MSKMKRSRHLALTTLMAAAAVNLTACGPQAPAAVTWDAPASPPVPAAEDEAVEAVSYSDPLACKAADQVADGECEQAWRTAQADHEANGPRYGDKAACEAEYGEGNCETRTSAGGGSFFMPFLAGMMLGRIGGGRGYYGGTGYYRDNRGRFSTPYGGSGSVFRNPGTGALQVSRAAVDPSSSLRRQAPYQAGRSDRAVSRGGFRSTRSYTGGRSYGG